MNNIIKGLALFAAICLSSGAMAQSNTIEKKAGQKQCVKACAQKQPCAKTARMCQTKACDMQCKKDCKMQCKDCKQCTKDCKQCTKACKEQCNKDCKKQCKACKQCPKASKKQNTKK